MEVSGEGFLQNVLIVAFANCGMVLKAAAGKLHKLILQIGDFGNAAAAKEFGFDHIIGKLGLAGIDNDLAILGLAVGNGDLHGLDAALVAAPAAAGIVLGEIHP